MNRPFDSRMMRVMLRPLVACLQIFALYVVVHGHYGPGGGFQGGVVLGCAFLLPLLVNGGSGPLTLSKRAADRMAAAGVLGFASIGALSLLWDRPMLDYAAIPLNGIEGPARRALGILGIEIGVTLAVAGVIVSLYYSLMGSEEA
jgi:multicomponent Na+:H+ antiporter subunit B